MPCLSSDVIKRKISMKTSGLTINAVKERLNVHRNTVKRLFSQYRRIGIVTNAQHLGWPGVKANRAPMGSAKEALNKLDKASPSPAGGRDAIPAERVRRLTISARRRCLAVMAANGGHNRYKPFSVSLSFSKMSDD